MQHAPAAPQQLQLLEADRAQRPAPRPVATLDPQPPLAPAPSPEATWGLYDTAHLAEDPFQWAEAVEASWMAAPDGSKEAALLQQLREVCYRSEPAPELMSEELRRQLWGTRGAASEAGLAAAGLRHFHSHLRATFEHMNPAAALVEAVRAYGDYLTFFHPDGQVAEGPPFDVYEPFRDMLPPAAPAPPPLTGAELRAKLLAELQGEELPARPRMAPLAKPQGFVHRVPAQAPTPERLLLTRQAQAAPPAPASNLASGFRQAAEQTLPTIILSTLAVAVVELLKGVAR